MQGELLVGEGWSKTGLYAASAPSCHPLMYSVVIRRKQWVLVGMEEGRGIKQTQFLPFWPSEVFRLKEVWVLGRQDEIPEVEKPWFTWPELAVRKTV